MSGPVGPERPAREGTSPRRAGGNALWSASLEEVADGGDASLDRALVEVPEAEDELRRGARPGRAAAAHAVEANGTSSGGRDDRLLADRVRKVRHSVEAGGQAGQ